MEKPKLRWPLEVRFEQAGSERVLLIRCPLGITPEPLVLIPAVAPLISALDGTLSCAQIAEKFSVYGVKAELVQQLAELLDRSFFLAGPRFEAEAARIKKEYLAAPVRPAALVGASYAASSSALSLELERYLLNKTDKAAAAGSLLCLVSPHIDYRRGSVAYGKTYNHIRAEEHDLYVVLGTSHQYSPQMFHLTQKDFATPFGILPTDQTFVQRLSQLYGYDRSFADEFLHRREHSLELQLPFLAFLKKQPRIVPILVGSFHHMLDSGQAPSDFGEYEEFVAALAEVTRERIGQGQKLLFIAGVDMAHVGQNFGDITRLTPEYMEMIKERDRSYLNAIESHDKKALFGHIAEDGDARRICGFPTMYLLLDLFERLGLKYRSELYEYRQAVDYNSDCAVTFAGMGLYI
ncbi:MAG: AmmeMemoRadiSam system protein B [Oligoflexia bacterium]|nr:AmmeMemoRadiSam system protein B [Oligoflexia bacterium]